MKLEKPNCPECGEPAHGTLERLSGCAEFAGVPGIDTSVAYSGWTEIWWDEQRTVLQDDDASASPSNRPFVCCPNGHTWPTAIDW